MSITELRKKWADWGTITTDRAERKIYSHPEAVRDAAVDLIALLDRVEDYESQLAAKVPRIIVDTESLNSLPVGSLIMEVDSEKEAYAFPWVKVAVENSPPLWSAPGDEQDYSATEVGLPAYVMWEPPAA